MDIKKLFLITAISVMALDVAALPRVHIIATGGTIAGKVSHSGYGYDAGSVGIGAILASVPELRNVADVDYEQFCNIGSQNMNEQMWLKLSRHIDSVLADSRYDAVVVTHGTDTMEETAFFLSLTLRTDKVVVLVGAMRPSDSPEADGPNNLLVAVRAAADPSNYGREVLCSMDGRILNAGSIVKFHTHAIDAIKELECSPNRRGESESFDISGVDSLPKVGIIYGYGGSTALPLRAFIDAGYEGVVSAGVGMGNFSADVEKIAAEAAANGMLIVRSSRVPYGGVHTELGEIDDASLGFIAARYLNPQKARILLMLALTRTKDRDAIREVFDSYAD